LNTPQNKSSEPIVIWFRQDLRIEDQPILSKAIDRGVPIIPLYIWSPEDAGKWSVGAAGKWWLHHSLTCLQSGLSELGLTLIIRQENPLKTLLDIIEETNAKTVLWNRCYEPFAIHRDTLIKSSLKEKGVEVISFNGSLLHEPWTILNKENKPFQIFTYYWKQCLKTSEPDLPLQTNPQVIPYAKKIASAPIPSLELLPKIHWDIGLQENWQPGEKHAKLALKKAIRSVISHYLESRDFPALEGTSGLSPYIHFGEISPNTIWHAVKAEKDLPPLQAEAFLRQLGWREFGYYLLYHFPDTPEFPLHRKFEQFPWKEDQEALDCWKKGLTGYPIIDAGMRQLRKTGWMHNRIRMIVGSFLVKDLLIPWQEGEKWFWDTLVDADLANNTLGWQWVGGCGADAAPYFRIFNPILQSTKFDAKGEYIKMWVPELASLPTKWLHCPWKAPEEVLRQAGITLGITYPKPIVDHDQARLRALEAFSALKN